jgi:hypothetical protein
MLGSQFTCWVYGGVYLCCGRWAAERWGEDGRTGLFGEGRHVYSEVGHVWAILLNASLVYICWTSCKSCRQTNANGVVQRCPTLTGYVYATPAAPSVSSQPVIRASIPAL